MSTVDCANDGCFNNDCVQCDFNCAKATLKSEPQIYLDIRDAILAKEVIPSYRGVGQHFKGVSRRVISSVLNDLHDNGILKEYRKGYAFA